MKVLERICKPVVMWEWDDFGVMLRVYRNTKSSRYHLSLDIQVTWLNVWVQMAEKSRWRRINKEK